MMKTSWYFIGAVATSLVVPAVIGCMVFLDVQARENNDNYVDKSTSAPEIVIFGDSKITDFESRSFIDKDFASSKHIDFEVEYLDGGLDYAYYNLSLNSIEFSPNVDPEDIFWVLLKYDEEKDEYKSINRGKFDSDEYISLVKRKAINLKDSDRYRLHYYVSEIAPKYNRGTIRAEVVLE